MAFFNKADSTFKTFAIAAIAFTAMPACFRPTTQAVDDPKIGIATFAVAEVTGKSEAIAAKATEPAVAEDPKAKASGAAASGTRSSLSSAQRRFSFKICVTDRKLSTPVENAIFALLNGKERIEVRTDSSGCFVLNHDVTIDPLAEEAYLPIKRTLLATANSKDHRGVRELKIAINPWSYLGSGEKEVVDLVTSKNAVPAGMILASESEVEGRLKGQVSSKKDTDVKSAPRSLFFKDYSLTSTPLKGDDSMVRRLVVLRFKPMLSINKDGKQARALDLDNADLLTRAAVVADVSKDGAEVEKHGLWIEKRETKAANDGSVYRVQFEVSFPNKLLDESARLKFLVQLGHERVEAARLIPFEASLDLGSLAEFLATTNVPAAMLDKNIGGNFSYAATVEAYKMLQAAPSAPQQPAPQAQPERPAQVPPAANDPPKKGEADPGAPGDESDVAGGDSVAGSGDQPTPTSDAK